ncbi:unnamed protein product [Lampetra fluviatilis]
MPPRAPAPARLFTRTARIGSAPSAVSRDKRRALRAKNLQEFQRGMTTCERVAIHRRMAVNGGGGGGGKVLRWTAVAAGDTKSMHGRFA